MIIGFHILIDTGLAYVCIAEKITASDHSAQARMGTARSIDGNFAVVGVPMGSNDVVPGNKIRFAGAAYLFENRPGGKWDYVLKIVPADRKTGNHIGGYLAAGHNYVIIGSEWDSYDATNTISVTNAGSAYICKSCFNMDNSVISTNGGLYAGSSPITYQWLECNNNYSAIPGATGQSFFPVGPGMYAVALSDGLCQDTSDCIGVIGVPKHDNPLKLNFYPNPTEGVVNLCLESVHDEIRLIVRKSLGQALITQKHLNVSSVTFRIDSTQGLYLVEVITTDHGYIVSKVLMY